MDLTRKAVDSCDVTVRKTANPGDVTDRVDQTQKADDPCDVTTRKRANSSDVTDRVDRTRKADDPCDVTAPKRANSDDVTDRVDRTRKADDPCDVTAPKRANSGDMTEDVLSSVLAPHGSRQSASSDFNNCSVTAGVTGGIVIGSTVTGSIVNYPAAECTLLEHLITETQLKIKSRDPTKHVSTYAERDAFRHLRAYGSVIIRGRSGSGKSHLGYTLLERVKKSCQRIPVKISSPDEWNHIHKSSTPDAEKKYVVMVDDIFGRTNLIQSSLDTWRQKFDLVWPLVESGQIWLVMTSRPEIITQGEPEIFGYEVINKAKEIILDEGKYCLREAEKLKFLDKLCGKYVRKEDVKEIATMDTALGFPQCCTFFAANENARLKGVEFFKKPFEFIKDLIDCVKKNQPEVYFVLLLVFMNEGRLSMKELKSVEHKDKFERQFKIITSCCMLKKARLKEAGIKYVAQSVCGVYLLESSGCFLFSHRSIYDVLFVDLCEDSPDVGIRMSTPAMLLEFIRINVPKRERCKQCNVVCIDEEDYAILAKKLRDYLSNENTRCIVLSHPAFQNTEFLHEIFKEWKADDIHKLCRHNGEEVVKDIALPLREKLGMPQTVNILKFKLFLSHVIVNRMKEFASCIIQSLCGYDLEDIQPVLNEALLCALYTCEKDLTTKLLSRGAKPNMLCFSTLCNSPQLDAETTSTVISQIEGNETNLKVLLTIAVISCNKTVVRVLIKKLNAQSEIHEQFYSHCLELLLHINGKGHEDIRQNTTNAGHEVLEVMTLLEEGGGKLDSKRISLASSHKDPSVLRSLLPRSCDGIHVTDEFGRTPLHLACMYGGADGVELLLKHGAELSVAADGSTPFHYALKSCVDQKEKLKLLLDKNSTNAENFVNLTDYMKCTALHYAAELLDSNCVKMLVEAQADTNVLDVSNQSPLFYASKEGIPDTVDILCKSNAITSKDIHGLQPIHYAAYGCYLHVLKIFIQNDCNTLVIDNNGRTLLHYIVTTLIQGQSGIGSILVKRQSMNIINMIQCLQELFVTGLSVNVLDKNDRSCVLDAAKWQRIEILKCLCEHGADITVKDKSERSIVTESALSEFDSAEKIQYLLGRGCFRNIDDEKQNAVMSAVLKEDEEAFEVLVDNGITINQRRNDGATLLHDAARQGQQYMVSRLLERGASVTIQDDNGDTPLHLYLMNDFQDDQLVEDMINADKSILSISNKKNQGLLHLAVTPNCDKCAFGMGGPYANSTLKYDAHHLSHATPHRCTTTRKLLYHGVNINMQDINGNTALSLAVMHGCLTCVIVLCDNNADPKVVNNKGYSALHISLTYPGVVHNHQVAKIMCERTDIHDKTKRHETSLLLAVSENCLSCVMFILENGSVDHLNLPDLDGKTPVHSAFHNNTQHIYPSKRVAKCSPHSHEILQTLLHKGADAGIRNKEGDTPLHRAAWQKCKECCELLLPVSDVNAQDSDGNTALQIGMYNYPHCHEIIQALLEKGANAGIGDMCDRTPLHQAIRDKCVKCVELLLPVSDVNAQDSDGNTALHCAFPDRTDHYSIQSHRPRCHEVVKASLEMGADAGIRNKKGETPLHRAAWGQYMECVELLLPLLNVNAQDSDGNTALHCAFPDRTNHYSIQSHRPRCDEVVKEVVKALLEMGADAGIRNMEGETPLHCAAWTLCEEGVELLSE